MLIDWVRTLDVADIVEEDEEVFLRSADQNFSTAKHLRVEKGDFDSDIEQEISDISVQLRDSCISAQPMKDDITTDMRVAQKSPFCPNFYPLDQEDWEDAIIWGNSPAASHGYSENCAVSELDAGMHSEAEIECHEQGTSGARENVTSTNNQSFENSYHPKLLRLESPPGRSKLYSSDPNNVNGATEVCKGDALKRFSKLSLLNKELLEGSWVDNIIWDSCDDIPKPKLILDLQDDQMLFEVLDEKHGEHLRSHAGAMVVPRTLRSSIEQRLELHSQGMTSAGRFNISNDKYYSNRKTTQQAKTHAKKRAHLGIKVMHSVPALKLQTMKPKLSKYGWPLSTPYLYYASSSGDNCFSFSQHTKIYPVCVLT